MIFGLNKIDTENNSSYIIKKIGSIFTSIKNNSLRTSNQFRPFPRVNISVQIIFII